MATLHTHALKDFAIAFGGNLMSGFGDDIAINIVYPNARWETVIGADGERTRQRNYGDLFAQCELTLKSSSDSNDKIALTALLDRISGGGVVPLSVIHTKGGEKYTGAEAFVTKNPDAEIGMNATDRVWNIDVTELIPAKYGLGTA